MTRAASLLAAALLLGAAGPSGGFGTGVPMPDFGGQSLTQQRPAPNAPPGYDVAPIPDQDAFAPTRRASNDASLGPGLFTRTDQYRGAGISPNSSAQIEQERRVKPGAGIRLNVPLQ